MPPSRCFPFISLSLPCLFTPFLVAPAVPPARRLAPSAADHLCIPPDDLRWLPSNLQTHPRPPVLLFPLLPLVLLTRFHPVAGCQQPAPSPSSNHDNCPNAASPLSPPLSRRVSCPHETKLDTRGTDRPAGPSRGYHARVLGCAQRKRHVTPSSMAEFHGCAWSQHSTVYVLHQSCQFLSTYILVLV